MLKWAIALLTLILQCGPAWSYPCPTDLESHREKKALHEWLIRLRGHRMIEGCKIEITACDPSEARTESQILGEVYVVDFRNREAYLPMTIADTANPKIRTQLKAYPNSFFYTKWDYYYESQFGRTETYRLDIRMTRDGRGVRSLALGTYSTYKALNHPNGNQSRWYNCGESYE